MIYHFCFVLFLKVFVKYIFINSNHALFRSLFCLFISCFSLFISSVYIWDIIENPIENTIINYYSYNINKFMISYLSFDLIYFAFYNELFTRLELTFHHIVCLFVLYFYSKSNILTLCTICEILSAFNWLGLLFPAFEYLCKYIRVFSILFVRLPIWMLVFLILPVKFVYYLILMSFISLDIYWLYIMYINYISHKIYIKDRFKNKKTKITSKFFIN